MIDCSRTENYFKEKARMTKKRKYGVCKLKCTDCPLSVKNNGTGVSCESLEMFYPEKAVVIVQKWSDEHSQRTYLSEFLKNYPNTPLSDNGTPDTICPYELGLVSMEDCKKGRHCIDCWNQPIEGGKADD